MAEIDKAMPQDHEAEKAILGAIIIEPEIITEVMEILSSEDFHDDRNRWVYQALTALQSSGREIDQITVSDMLNEQNHLDAVGRGYISQILAETFSSAFFKSHVAIVKRHSLYRQMIDLSGKVAVMGFEASTDVNNSIDKAWSIFDQFRRSNTSSEKLITPYKSAEIIMSMMEGYRKSENKLSWGFTDMDNITSGIFPGELTIIGARPSIGKTQLMLDVAEFISVSLGKTVLFSSLEMSIPHVLERKVARYLSLNIGTIRNNGLGALSEEAENKLMELVGELSEKHIYYLSGSASSQEIYNTAKKLRETKGLDILFVDYLQLMKDCSSEKENQNVRTGRACKVMKQIANELDIPVIVASQLNRALEYRGAENKKPTLADLRDSGEIEQHADLVFLLHRNTKDDRILEVKMAKNRQMGTAGAIQLTWIANQHRYGDLYREEI